MIGVRISVKETAVTNETGNEETEGIRKDPAICRIVGMVLALLVIAPVSSIPYLRYVISCFHRRWKQQIVDLSDERILGLLPTALRPYDRPVMSIVNQKANDVIYE